MRIVCICFTLLVLSSCMKVSEVCQNPSIMHPQNLALTSKEATSTPYFKRGDWPTSSWWTNFNSPMLNELIERALAQNPTLQNVVEKVEVEKQRAIGTKSGLFPSIFFGGEETWARVSKNGFIHALNPSLGTIYNLVDFQLGFEYEIDFWGKNRNRFKAAVGEYKAQLAEAKQAEIMITTELAKAFFAFQTNVERRAIYRELKELKEKISSLDQSLFFNAIDSKFAPLTAIEQLGDVDKEIAALDSQIDEAMHALNILAARGPDSEVSSSLVLSDLPTQMTLPDNLSSDLIARRPDLIAQIWHIEALAHEVNVAVADFFPRVDLRGSFGLETFNYRNLFDWASATLGLAPSIHLPIFKAGEIRANFKRNQAELNSGIQVYNELLLNALGEVSNAVSFVEKAYKQKEVQQVILNQALTKLELQELRTEIGIDNQIRLLESRAEYLYRQLENVMITYAQYQAVIEMIRALGGGYQAEDLARLNCGE